MSRAPRIGDDAFYRPSLVGADRPASGAYMVGGYVPTRYGVVGVNVWDYNRADRPRSAGLFGTEFVFVHRGRHHRDTYSGRHFTDRGLVTVAGRMARRIAEEG